MSKSSLQGAINKLAKKFEGNNPKLVLREQTADKMAQALHITPLDLVEAITSQAAKQGYQLKQQDILPFIYRFMDAVYNGFKTKKNYVSEIEGSPRDFTIYVRQDGATGSVFKLALRQQLNPFLAQLERDVANFLGVEEERLVRGIKKSRLNNKGESVTSVSKGFLHLGHVKGSSIAEKGPSLSLTPDIQKTIVKNSSETLNLFLEKNGFFKSTGPFIELIIESETLNSQTASDKKRESGLLAALREELLKLDISDVKGSPSLKEEIFEELEAAANKRPSKNKNTNTKVSKKAKVQRKTQLSRLKLKAVLESQKVNTNWASVIAVINAKLAATVKSNMGAPGLVNRTGTFAESARVTDVQMTAQGYPSFGTTYDKTPYGVFDRVGGALPWATPERDPQTIIQKSVREILTEMAIGRFYLRRV